jgi:hypothetical protein
MEIRLTLLILGLCALAQIEARPALKVLDKRQLGISKEVQNVIYQQAAPQIYYIPTQDGSFRYFQEINLPGYQPLQFQQQFIQQEVKKPLILEQQVVQGLPSKTGGNLFSVLEKPVSAVGNIIDKTGNVLTSVVDVPANLAKDVVGAVGLDKSVIGHVASGVVDTAAAVVKAPVQLVSSVAQAPFKAVSGLFSALGG